MSNLCMIRLNLLEIRKKKLFYFVKLFRALTKDPASSFGNKFVYVPVHSQYFCKNPPRTLLSILNLEEKIRD